MNTSQVGERAEGAVLSEFIKHGYKVLIPFASHSRYDLVVEHGGKFHRIQVKNGLLRGETITFRSVSSTGQGEKRVVAGYTEDADLFAVYCHELNKVYILRVAEVGEGSCCLRLSKARNGQQKKTKMAEQYELGVHSLPV